MGEGEAAVNPRPSRVASMSSRPFWKSYERKEGGAEGMHGAREMAGLEEAWEGLRVWVRVLQGDPELTIADRLRSPLLR